jgi:MacB-like periplasmic core domain
MLRDLHFALRLLVKSPGFTALVVGSLAIGIAVNALLFTLVNALLLRPLPYARPGELVEIDQPRRTLPLDELRGARAFDGVAAYLPWNFAVAGPDGARLVFSCRVSANLFQVLGVSPALGRTFAPGDEQEPVVILGYDYWRQTSGDPGIIGQTLTIEGQKRTVIGVLPAEFTLFFRDGNLWIPQRMTEGRVLTRLHPGVSAAQAEAEANAIAGGLPAEPGATERRRQNASHTAGSGVSSQRRVQGADLASRSGVRFGHHLRQHRQPAAVAADVSGDDLRAGNRRAVGIGNDPGDGGERRLAVARRKDCQTQCEDSQKAHKFSSPWRRSISKAGMSSKGFDAVRCKHFPIRK